MKERHEFMDGMNSYQKKAYVLIDGDKNSDT